MLGPVRFVFTVLWIAIALHTLGSLRACTKYLGTKAGYSQQHETLELGKWNRELNRR